MATELPPVSQEFDADVDPYIAGVDEMIAKNEEFLAQLDDIIGRVGELAVALDSLPRDIVITIRYEEIGRPDIVSAATQTVRVNQVVTGNENLPPVVTRTIRDQFSDVGDSVSAAAAQAAALRDVIQQFQQGAISGREYIAIEKELTSSQFMAANMAARQANAQRESTDAITAWWTETNKATPDSAAFATTMAMAAAAIARANAVLAPFNAAARTTGASLAAIPIAGGLAAFGITSLGTAIHLVVMGIAEFLAVFLPAMYAAAAGAYVMMQGVQLVTQHITGLYTATEALGPMMNTTAGDMLGLGHSIQTAQDLANPGVFELLGESIGAINAFSGRATLGLDGLTLTAKGAAGGLTDFSQTGLDVTHMLDAFGAKVVADLQGPLGGTLHQLVSSATSDLQAFGQILGNLGHAIISLAADMPGLAEVILHVIDGITALISWFAQLPHGLITAIFVIEEMYRWSGLLAGAFGLLGRGIALLGTLGIPVFIAIGRNVATMVANVIAGVSNMIGNFGLLLSKIGLIGEDGVQSIAKFRNVLAGMVGFLSGPWGVAIGLGIVAVGAFIFWMSRAKTATEEWINSAQQAVTKASNLQVLNVIAQQMAESQIKLANANVQLNQANNEMTKGAAAAAQKVTQEQDALIKQGQAAGQAAGMQQTYTQKQIEGSNAAADAANKINQLTAFQKNLILEQTHVVEGASQISKAYGVDFVTALGLADMAGVKLESSIGKNGQLTAQAAIQIGALVLGYEKMDQTGGILANSMGAVNIQAGLQSSRVQQLNQAWDQFIQMGTALTGSFAQFNLDLGQMGNSADLVGKKIVAFTGTTGQSVAQIANALKSFGQSSAQTWLAYNQSITQANTFTDALRTASAAGVVTQKQYGEGIAGVVQQLEPYASKSKAALAELMMISQEAGGPAYNTTKGLTGNYQDLKNWTDQNAVSSGKWANLLNTLTEKITNVSKVAQGFAGTLQTDVLNAMAQAGAGTTKITQLTEAYTNALTKNGAQAPQTKSAQDALTKALEAYGFKATDITQMENILSQAYIKNTQSISAGVGTRLNLQKDIDRAIATVPTAKSDLDRFTSSISNGTSTTRAGESARQNLINDLIKSGVDANTARADVSNMSLAISRIPKTATLNIKESGTGFFTITEGGKNYSISAGGLFSPHASGGPIEHGTGPKSDDVLIRASKGEYVMQASSVDKYGKGMMDAINAGAFASGGLIAQFNKSGPPGAGVAGALGKWTDSAVNDFAGVMSMTMENAMIGQIKADTAAAQSSLAGAYAGKGSGNYAADIQAVLKVFGLPLSLTANWLRQIQTESGGNLNAVNRTDSNAAAGHPSVGLLQLIPGTFAAYAGPYRNTPPLVNYGGGPVSENPMAQIYAAIHYADVVYHGAAMANVIGHGHGYDSGGWLMPGVTLAVNNTGKPERVSPPGGDGGNISIGEGRIVIELDGKQIWTNQQQYTLKYNMRNAGKPTGTVIPGR